MTNHLKDTTRMPTKITRVDDEMAVQLPTYASTLMDIFEKGSTEMINAFSNYVAFASQIERADGTNPIASRLGFVATNLSNLHNTQVHGNRLPYRVKTNKNVPMTDSNGKKLLDCDQHGQPIFQPPTTEEMSVSNIRFAATQNVSYRQGILDKFVRDAQSNAVGEEVYQDDLAYQQAIVNLRDSELWLAFVHAMRFWPAIHEVLTDEQFVYVPYAEKQARASYGSASSISALAATLRKPKTG